MEKWFKNKEVYKKRDYDFRKKKRNKIKKVIIGIIIVILLLIGLYLLRESLDLCSNPFFSWMC